MSIHSETKVNDYKKIESWDDSQESINLLFQSKDAIVGTIKKEVVKSHEVHFQNTFVKTLFFNTILSYATLGTDTASQNAILSDSRFNCYNWYFNWNFDNLPTEIIHLIVNFCTKCDILKCCVLSKRWSSIAIKYLYRDPFGTYSTMQLNKTHTITTNEENKNSYETVDSDTTIFQRFKIFQKFEYSIQTGKYGYWVKTLDLSNFILEDLAHTAILLSIMGLCPNILNLKINCQLSPDTATKLMAACCGLELLSINITSSESYNDGDSISNNNAIEFPDDRMKNLSTLFLSGANFAIKSLSSSKLTALHLSKILNLPHLTLASSNLAILRITECQFDDKIFLTLQVPNLRVLDLWGTTNIHDKQLSQFLKTVCHSLEAIDISFTGAGMLSIEVLSTCFKLTTLFMEKIEEVNMYIIKKLLQNTGTGLRELVLCDVIQSNENDVIDDLLNITLECSPGLVQLDAVSCSGQTSASTLRKIISSCKNLKTLILDESQIPEHELGIMSELKNLFITDAVVVSEIWGSF